MRAERKLGELLATMDKHPGGNVNRSHAATGWSGQPTRLHDLGISKSQSSRWQAIAAVPEHVFDQHLADVREQGRRDGTTELTSAGAILLARQYRPHPRTLVPLSVSEPPDSRDRFDVADAAALPWPDGSVDLLVTSPPYGLGLPYTTADSPDYAAWLAALKRWLAELLRVACPDWGRLCLNVPLDRDLDGWQAVSADALHVARAIGWQFRTWLIWDKGQAGTGHRPRQHRLRWRPERHRSCRVGTRLLPRSVEALGSGVHTASSVAGPVWPTRSVAISGHFRCGVSSTVSRAAA